jgi:hypothetical protein
VLVVAVCSGICVEALSAVCCACSGIKRRQMCGGIPIVLYCASAVVYSYSVVLPMRPASFFTIRLILYAKKVRNLCKYMKWLVCKV